MVCSLFYNGDLWNQSFLAGNEMRVFWDIGIICLCPVWLLRSGRRMKNKLMLNLINDKLDLNILGH